MSEGRYEYDLPPPGQDPQVIKSRVTAPAIFLIVVNVLNLLAGIYFLFNGFVVKNSGAALDAELQKQWDDMPQEQKDAMKQLGINSPQDFVTIGGNFYLIWGALTLLIGLLGLVGGIRMMALGSYGLAMTGAILTAIPCVTPCCLLGQIAGIWALIVLMNSDVRSAFR